MHVNQGHRPTGEDTRLLALFDELEKRQIDFLDEAAKRIIEMATALLGLLFAVAAFGKDFPPPYLQGGWARGLLVLTLALYLLAMLAGWLGLQPRRYRRYTNNLTKLREELDRILRWKAGWFRAGSALFFLASLCLAVLVGRILLAI